MYARICISTVFPLRTHSQHVESIHPNDVRMCVSHHLLLGESITTLLSYKDCGTKDLITALKYEHCVRATRICATVLADYLCETIATDHALSPRRIVIVPIPPHIKRKRERGIDHTRRICKYLPTDIRNGPLASVRTDFLIRSRYTPPQAHLHRRERLANIRGAFSLPYPEQIKGSHIYLIDDVTTTGATLGEAAKTLRRAGAYVTPIAIARA